MKISYLVNFKRHSVQRNSYTRVFKLLRQTIVHPIYTRYVNFLFSIESFANIGDLQVFGVGLKLSIGMNINIKRKLVGSKLRIRHGQVTLMSLEKNNFLWILVLLKLKVNKNMLLECWSLSSLLKSFQKYESYLFF